VDPISAIVAAVGAVTGVIAVIATVTKNKNDGKLGLVREEREGEDAWQKRYAALLDDITEHQVRPRQERIEDLLDHVEKLRAQRDDLRRRHRLALDFIRVLLRWIADHTPADNPSPRPEVPDDIRDDL
jgi:formate dehydrogenase maturation protein FdhE